RLISPLLLAPTPLFSSVENNPHVNEDPWTWLGNEARSQLPEDVSEELAMLANEESRERAVVPDEIPQRSGSCGVSFQGSCGRGRDICTESNGLQT
uniref:Uncharacterized protein n=1 Tax=Scleropages formosus TaxID=113540 RepID=A0A8C9R7R0_SCLFO